MKKTLGLISASLLLVSGSMLAIGARERVVAKAPMKSAEAALEMLSSNPEDNASVKFIDGVTIDFGADLAVLDSSPDLDLNIKTRPENLSPPSTGIRPTHLISMVMEFTIISLSCITMLFRKLENTR